MVALRGVRGIKKQIYSNIDSLSFNLIPHKNGYEVPWRFVRRNKIRNWIMLLLILFYARKKNNSNSQVVDDWYEGRTLSIQLWQWIWLAQPWTNSFQLYRLHWQWKLTSCWRFLSSYEHINLHLDVPLDTPIINHHIHFKKSQRGKYLLSVQCNSLMIMGCNEVESI